MNPRFLRHEFNTACGWIGCVRECAYAIKTALASQLDTAQHLAAIDSIILRLDVLLRDFQQHADSYKDRTEPVDIQLANSIYQRGLQEWRNNLGQLMKIAEAIVTTNPGMDSPALTALLGPLQQLEQQKVQNLQDILGAG